jgi:hypothetical protein
MNYGLTDNHNWDTCVCGCPAEANMYNPHIKNLNFKIVSYYFIGYPERSKGFRFDYPSHITRIVETKHAIFFKNDNFSGSNEKWTSNLQEKDRIYVPTLVFTNVISSPLEINDGTNVNNVSNIDEVPILPQESSRKSQRARKSIITNDYIVYLAEEGCDLDHGDDPIFFKQAYE